MGHDESTTQLVPDTAGLVDPPDYAEISHWLQSNSLVGASEVNNIEDHGVAHTPVLAGRWTRCLVKLSGAWALIELPVEYWGAQDGIERIALTLTAALWLAIISLVLRGSQLARGVFVFLCALGVLAVAPALPAEFASCRLAFCLSLIECAVKSMLFIAFVSRYILMEA
ncbi:hypothetical protein AB4Y44_27860 [Paraburkholderia sp. BR10937]|uniref:hypothetical protein n=1 Tax=Paraburkholderia sp. BR10937 TaxID=3236994 RepID=UPI0034D288D6